MSVVTQIKIIYANVISLVANLATDLSNTNALMLSEVNTQSIKYQAMPIGAPVAIISDGAAGAWAYPAANAHVTIQAAGLLVADPSWFCGIVILSQTLAVGDYADIAIGYGVDGAGIDLAEFSFYNELAAGAGIIRPVISYLLPKPIKCTGNLRVCGRIRKASVASATGITVKCIFATGI